MDGQAQMKGWNSMRRLLLALFGLGVVSLCGPSVLALSQSVSDVEWRVTEIEGSAVEDAGVLVFFRNQLGGKAACNRIFGQFAKTPNGQAFTGIGVSKMFCEGKMEREQALLKALERMQSHKEDGLTLILLDGDGKPLVKLVR